ncbi:MAG: family 16 glycoside hydrolase [Planctomycetota bacterium]
MKPSALVCLILAACAARGPAADISPPTRRFEERRLAMGVQARIVLYAESQLRAQEAFHAAFGRIEELESILSDWRPDSELSRLNDAAGGAPLAVSPVLWTALERSLDLARRSSGAFDPTVGPLVALWRLAKAEGRLPERPAVDLALARTRWEKVELDPAGRTARLPERGMRLDLGAIGQGLACDEALGALRAHGTPAALVDIGGDVAAGDPPPGKAGWAVAAGARVLEIARAAVTCSGDAENRIELAGVRYSHVLDPRTGEAVQGGVAMSVIASDATTADALATAAAVLGARAGRALVEREGGRLLVDDPRAVTLFDGVSLAGWTSRGGRYDGDALWTVEEGCLVGRVNEKGEGGLLYTEGLYTSFVFECEVRIDHPFDSGVFLRMVPADLGLKGAQVTLDDRPDGEIAAIYADGFLLHNEAARAHWKKDAWNHVEVRCTGFDMRIEVWLNGIPVADHQVPPSVGEYASRGRIGLQVHGGMGEPKESAARFREIRVRELPVFGEQPLTPEAGWSPLFDGESLRGFEEHGTSGSWRARDGILSCLSGPEGGDLRTLADYEDFELRLDFKIARMANSGVFLRAKRDGSNPAYSGCELQILDDFDWERETGTKLEPWQLTGSLYGAIPAAAPGALNPPGEWNTYEILFLGKRLAVALNGRTLYDVDVESIRAEPPFRARARAGFIGLQRYSRPGSAGEEVVSFRNFLSREL